MGRRREPRVKLDVPVKVCGMDKSGHPFVQTAYAVSVSRTGVRLTGVGPLVRVGEVVVVIYKQRKARFRVVWTGEIGQPEFGQAGLETSEPNTLIWDFSLPYPAIDGYTAAANPSAPPSAATAATTAPLHTMAEPGRTTAVPTASTQQNAPAPGVERRNAARYKCRGSAEIFIPSVSFPTRGQIDDISLSGVYVQTTAPLLVGNDIKLNLAVHGFMLQAEAQVRTSHPGVGMGLMFTNMTPENRQVLGSIINRLSGSTAPAAASASFVAPVAAAASPATAADSSKWDAVAREIADWFRTHDNLSREEYFAIIRRS
jgi:hypothetical protein